MKKGEVFERMVVFVAILIIIIVMLFVGYSIYSYCSYGTKEGTIIDKHYSPAYTYVSTITSYVDGKSINIPTQRYEPEHYTFVIQKNISNKVKATIISVTREEFESFNIGDYFKR